jgi:hypothetical protein
MEIDHIFICVPPAANEAELLIDFGFKEGSGNIHPGQGTANRRFFFDNIMLELLFLTDAEEAQSELTRPTMLYQRLTSECNEVSPFGLCFRPAIDDRGNAASFPCWAYRPTYLPPELHIDVADAPVDEPMWFFLSFASRPDKSLRCQKEPRNHTNGISELWSIEITSPKAGDLSTTAEIVAVTPNIKFLSGENHLLSLCFNDLQAGLVKDFQPDLPLIIKW